MNETREPYGDPEKRILENIRYLKALSLEGNIYKGMGICMSRIQWLERGTEKVSCQIKIRMPETL